MLLMPVQFFCLCPSPFCQVRPPLIQGRGTHTLILLVSSMYKGALSSSDLSTSHHEFGLGDADTMQSLQLPACTPVLICQLWLWLGARRAASSANWHSVAFVSFAFAVYLLYSYGQLQPCPPAGCTCTLLYSYHLV